MAKCRVLPHATGMFPHEDDSVPPPKACPHGGIAAVAQFWQRCRVALSGTPRRWLLCAEARWGEGVIMRWLPGINAGDNPWHGMGSRYANNSGQIGMRPHAEPAVSSSGIQAWT